MKGILHGKHCKFLTLPFLFNNLLILFTVLKKRAFPFKSHPEENLQTYKIAFYCEIKLMIDGFFCFRVEEARSKDGLVLTPHA